MKTNTEWLTELQAMGEVQERALAELRALVLRTARAFLSKPAQSRYAVTSEEARQLAEDSTQEALLIIRSKLGDFRGDSRFTTWVYTIVIRAVLGELRRRKWQEVRMDTAQIGVSLPDWPIDEAVTPGPERSIQQQQLWQMVRSLIETELTERQRTVLVAHVFQDMPLDQVAEHLSTNRDNVYKLLHDARKRLKALLLARGLSHREIINQF